MSFEIPIRINDFFLCALTYHPCFQVSGGREIKTITITTIKSEHNNTAKYSAISNLEKLSHTSNSFILFSYVTFGKTNTMIFKSN